MLTQEQMMNFQETLSWTKFKMPLLMGGILSPVVLIIEKYIFNEWEFLFFLFVIIGLDTFTGIWKSLKYKVFESHKLGRIVEKVVLYCIFLILLHVMTNHAKHEWMHELFGWIESGGYAALVIRESISVIENIGAIRPGLIPNWILKRLKQFDDEGTFNKYPANNENTDNH